MGREKSGRKAVPKGLKLLKGTFQSCRENKDAPQPGRGTLQAPAHLTPVAAAEYERKAELLDRLGVFTEADDAALAIYAAAYGRWVEAEKKLAKLGNIVKSPKGDAMRNPYAYVLNNAVDQMYHFLTEFGLTPASRQRVKVERKDATSEWQIFSNPTSV